jgi:hypothetical protein
VENRWKRFDRAHRTHHANTTGVPRSLLGYSLMGTRRRFLRWVPYQGLGTTPSSFRALPSWQPDRPRFTGRGPASQAALWSDGSFHKLRSPFSRRGWAFLRGRISSGMARPTPQDDPTREPRECCRVNFSCLDSDAAMTHQSKHTSAGLMPRIGIGSEYTVGLMPSASSTVRLRVFLVRI